MPCSTSSRRECRELRDAPQDQVLDETADVYEVLLAIASHRGLTLETVADHAAVKRGERGAFADRVYLESCSPARPDEEQTS